MRSAGLRSVMNAYSELDGVPAAADRELLTGMLREQWGFVGCVVADYFAVRQLADYHRLAADAVEAAAMALDAGLDVELPGTDCFGAPLLEAIRSGRVAEATVDTAVAPRAHGEVRARAVRAAIRRARWRRRGHGDAGSTAVSPATSPAESLVLLRNDGTLPLRRHVASVAVIGPNADEARHLVGDYTYPVHVESLQEMLRSGRNVFAIPIDDEALPRGRRPSSAPSVARRAAPSVSATASGSPTAATSTAVDSTGFADAVAARRRLRRRRDGDGRQGRADRRLHERREPRRRVTRPARGAGGPRPGRARHRARRSCSCSSPDDRSGAPRCTSGARRC